MDWVRKPRKPREPKRIRYKETFPEEIIAIMDATDYGEFFQKRYDEVSKILDFHNPLSKHTFADWKFKRETLNKDGTVRKKYYPHHLQTKKCRDKQAKNFKAFKKKQYEENQRIKLALEEKKKEIMELIGAHGYDLSDVRLQIIRKRS
jgi:hypothetical protein